MKVGPVTLEGEVVRLEPATLEHVEALWSAGDANRYPDIWRYIPFLMRSRDDMRAFVELATTGALPGWRVMFVTTERATGHVVGSTSFLNVDEAHRRLEIGGTWVTPPRQRSAVNTETKLLQLTHCFDELGCARVEFKTDARNQQSRAALRRIGATEEGTFRKHMLMPDGAWRDSVYFSILDTEWPEVSIRLRGLLDR